MCSQTPRVELFFFFFFAGNFPQCVFTRARQRGRTLQPKRLIPANAKATGSGGHPSPRDSLGAVPAETFAVLPDSVSSCFMSLAERFSSCIYIFMHQMFEIKPFILHLSTSGQLGEPDPRVENNVHSCTEVGCC